MKPMKFKVHLIPRILSGEKTCTWRLNDDKDLQTGDHAQFINADTLQVFATAVLTKVTPTILGQLPYQGGYGHGSYGSREHMYETFKAYYGPNINDGTPVKVVEFRVIGQWASCPAVK